MPYKIAFKTLGCRLNQYETDAVASAFSDHGYEVVDFREHADVYVINTCMVTGQSEHDSRNIINQATRKGDDPLVVVTGCVAEQKKDMLSGNSRIMYVVGNRQKSSIFQMVDAYLHGEVADTGLIAENPFGFDTVHKGLHTRTAIKVQDGCNKYCTYCIVPSVRGKPVSRPVQEVIENVRQVVAAGFKEIVITGVNIVTYTDGAIDFTTLLKQIIDVDGDFRVRVSSIEPYNIGEQFFALFDNPKLCPHLHMCLQSGSDAVLKRMNRHYSVAEFMNIVTAVRQQYPDFNFTTDAMVGFPGETDSDFMATCNVIQKAKFSHVHVFRYSERPGTRAADMNDKVPETIKQQRGEQLRNLAERGEHAYYSSFIGKHQRVLIEKVLPDGTAKGHGEHYIPVVVGKMGLAKNTFIEAEITSFNSETGNLMA